jgi:hypothetical protein
MVRLKALDDGWHEQPYQTPPPASLAERHSHPVPCGLEALLTGKGASQILDPDLATALLDWRRQATYAGESDFVFADDSGRPRWQGMILKDYVQPAAASGNWQRWLAFVPAQLPCLAEAFRCAGRNSEGTDAPFQFENDA